jgi:hypothetical protein
MELQDFELNVRAGPDGDYVVSVDRSPNRLPDERGTVESTGVWVGVKYGSCIERVVVEIFSITNFDDAKASTRVFDSR